MRTSRIPYLAISAALLSVPLVGCTPPPTESGSTQVGATSGRLPIPPAPGEVTKGPTGPPVYEDEYDEDEAVLQEGFSNLVPKEQVPEVVGNVTEALGDKEAKKAYAWAASAVGATMFVSSLWDSSRFSPKPYGIDFYTITTLMAPEPAKRWLALTERDDISDENLREISELVIIPEPLPEGATWLQPALQQWQYELLSAKIAEPLADGASRPIEFTIRASALGAYALNGKFYQFSVERTQTFIVSRSTDPAKDWVLLDWKVDPPIFSEVIELADAPGGAIIPNPIPTEISEGTPIPDPDFPPFDTPRRGQGENSEPSFAP